MYRVCVKRLLDLLLSGIALIVFAPLFVILIFCGAVFMHGNPFFVYPRVGKKERVFRIIKFRSMTELKDESGEYLPDKVRLNKYGRILRATSLDELPELINILRGDMSIVGPRPLPCRYLKYYTKEEKHRHDVRPGLTGLAQINGRNSISWEERFKYDLDYVANVTFFNDVKIVFNTIIKVLKRSDIGEGNASVESLHEVRSKNISQKEE